MAESTSDMELSFIVNCGLNYEPNCIIVTYIMCVKVKKKNTNKNIHRFSYLSQLFFYFLLYNRRSLNGTLINRNI